MAHQTTITRKGQLSLSKAGRKHMHLPLESRVELHPSVHGDKLGIRALPSLSSLAGSFAVKNPKNPVSLRARMERRYRRA